MLADEGDNMPMTRPAPRSKGFTMIELAIAMVIFGFLILAAAPSVQDWFSNTRIRGAAESLQNGLQTARSEAIRRNRTISFWLVSTDDANAFSSTCTLSDTSGSWIVSVNAPTGSCDSAPSTTDSPMIVTGRPIGDSGSRVSVTATQSDASTPATAVTFNGFGHVTNTTDAIGQIDIHDVNSATGTRPLRLVISTSGMVRMCDPAVTSSEDPRKC